MRQTFCSEIFRMFAFAHGTRITPIIFPHGERDIMKPTFSRDHRIEMHLNNGMFNGKPLYIHDTSAETFPKIIASRCFMARPNNDRRGAAAKSGIYMVRSGHAFNALQAFQQLREILLPLYLQQRTLFNRQFDFSRQYGQRTDPSGQPLFLKN